MYNDIRGYVELSFLILCLFLCGMFRLATGILIAASILSLVVIRLIEEKLGLIANKNYFMLIKKKYRELQSGKRLFYNLICKFRN